MHRTFSVPIYHQHPFDNEGKQNAHAHFVFLLCHQSNASTYYAYSRYLDVGQTEASSLIL
ncbi:hypothetical protein BCU68_03030 [Vibrio sp. 10N.286.49.B3]|uniref:hypothetical protein n=1 Tax=Vibrio sp. 10N.286.49.B3 TaxID=1880855 RepID=UPI000C84D63C|nr:hypothetical protein [Vibrio sp. 10N.286.49.B3]PMH44491.1 hypothetical protein BCU68_03030 [Vibrio sp. 10N.286.49.B3]